MIATALQHETYRFSTSTSTLIETYIESLLGRGDLSNDPRIHMDYRDKFEILATFAEELVTTRKGSLSTTAFMDMLDRFFESVGWSESSIELMEELCSRRILRRSGNQVSFSQNAFLFYFAAQRARSSSGFRAELFENPLRHGQTLRSYASITRDDGELLEVVVQIATNETDARSSGPRGVFATRNESLPTVELDEILRRLDDSNLMSADPEVEVFEDDAAEFYPQRRDEDPFPADEAAEEEPATASLSRAAFICSSLLRDLDLVRDAELKSTALSKVLLLWGQLAEEMSEDEFLIESVRTFSGDIASEMSLSSEDSLLFADLMVSSFPMLFFDGRYSFESRIGKARRVIGGVDQEASLCSRCPAGHCRCYLSICASAGGLDRALYCRR